MQYVVADQFFKRDKGKTKKKKFAKFDWGMLF